jgi:hypothetical protein
MNPADNRRSPTATIVTRSRHPVEREEHARQVRAGRGPSQEEEQQQHGHSHQHGDHIIEARHVEAEPTGRETRFPQSPQELPAVGEVTGQKQHDEQPDRLDRLDAQQVDPGIARARTGAERDEQERQGDRAEKRHVAEAPQLGVVEVHQAHGGHTDRAADHSLGEPRVQGQITNRVAALTMAASPIPHSMDQGKHERSAVERRQRAHRCTR